MNRQTTRISPADVDRQRDFCQKLHERFAARPSAPLAFVDTYGCQQNEADSERLRGYLSEMGYQFTQSEAEADLIVINTCAIREHAEMRVLGNVGALVHTKRAKPGQLICVCGCMAQEPHMAQKIKDSYRQVDLVFGPHALWRFPELLYRLVTRRGRIFDIADEPGSIAEGIPLVRQEGVKAWVSIMYGCNNFCTYCIVPYVRGRERSRRPEIILDEIRGLVAEGYKDITLLGQNVNSYGKDLEKPYDFSDLLRDIDAIPGDYRIRFMSSHPKDATKKLFDTMAQSRHVARQLHLPFQSGNDRVLKEMNRRYTRAQYLELVNYAKSVMPDIVLTSDVIIGFPGETEAEAMDTVSLVDEVGFDALFTFIYSPRPGTKAAAMPDPATKEEKQVWFDRLLAVQNAKSAEIHAGYIGRTVRVLVDGRSGDENYPLSSRTEGNRLVRLKGDESLMGQFVQARITGSNTWALYGEVEETTPHCSC